jgi:PAS domain S-box-containing protein
MTVRVETLTEDNHVKRRRLLGFLLCLIWLSAAYCVNAEETGLLTTQGRAWSHPDITATSLNPFWVGIPACLVTVCLAVIGLLVWNRSLNSRINEKTQALNLELRERKRMEDALRESEERYRSIFENSIDGILLSYPNQRILAANPAACRMLGRTEAELMQLDLNGLADPALSRLKRFSDERAAAGKCTSELTLRRGDGTEFPSEVSSGIFTDKDGQPRATLIIRDISERQKAAQALHSAHQRFQDMIEFLPDATVVIDREKRVIAWNRVMEEMTGVRKADILGKADYAYSIPFYGEGRPMLIDMVADGDLDIAKLYDYVDKKGEKIFGESFVPGTYEGKGAYLWGTASSLLDRDGQVIGAIQSIRDISGRKQAEEELRLSEERFRAIFESAQESIFLKDRSLRYTLVNPAMERLFGLPAWRLVGMTDSELFGDEIGELLNESDSRVLAGEVVLEEHTKPVNGSTRTFQTMKVPIRDNRGGIAAVCGIARDITHRRETEEALRESEEQLRFLSSKLLTVMEEERKRIAQELHDSIGQYLVAFKFSLEGALRTADSLEGAMIKDKLAVLIPIVQEAIDESRRICNGLRPSILDDMGIITTIGWLCREFRKTCPGMDVQERLSATENDIPEPLKIVIFRIAQEALNNAAKYSRAEHVDVSLSRTANRIELTVEDSGRGFDVNEAISRNPYERGLGLTGMHERTELSGGSFSIRSMTGKGTIVHASWPLGTNLRETHPHEPEAVRLYAVHTAARE